MIFGALVLAEVSMNHSNSISQDYGEPLALSSVVNT